MRILVSIFSGVIFITLMIIIIQVIFKCTKNLGGVLNLSLGRGCRPDLETLTLFMINHGKLIPLFLIFRSNSTHFFGQNA